VTPALGQKVIMTNNADNTGDRPVPSGADDMPTPEEEKAADRAAESSGDVSEAYEKQAKLGAAIKGEGEIDL
jgi:hypothetical protein